MTHQLTARKFVKTKEIQIIELKNWIRHLAKPKIVKKMWNFKNTEVDSRLNNDKKTKAIKSGDSSTTLKETDKPAKKNIM